MKRAVHSLHGVLESHCVNELAWAERFTLLEQPSRGCDCPNLPSFSAFPAASLLWHKLFHILFKKDESSQICGGKRAAFMSAPAGIRILSVDDHPLLREGIAAVINSQPDMQVIAQACNAQDAIQLFRKHQPDVTLMDLRLPDKGGIETMISIRAESPEARVIILTTFEGDVEVQRALEAGARAYLLKSMPPKELVEVIRQVHAGKKRIPPQIAAHLAEHMSDESLTTREIEVLTQIAEGNRNRDIGEKLFITEETVKVHVKHIMEKLSASDRTQAVAIAIRRGIIHLK